MASDDRRPPLPPDDAAAEAARIDDGLIHEWLDGQCDEVTAAHFEALVHAVPAFAERVAEARGFTAAASRILGALDEVPGDVLPARPRRVDSASSAAPARRRGPSRTLTQWSAIAAVLAVAATGVWMARPVSAPVAEMAVSVPLDGVEAATRLADDVVAPAAAPMEAAPIGAAPTMVSLGEVLDTSATARAIVEAARAPRPASPVVSTASAEAAPTAAASTMVVAAGAVTANDLRSTAAEAPAARKASAAVASAESETRGVAASTSAAVAASAPAAARSAPAPAVAARRALAASAPVERALGETADATALPSRTGESSAVEAVPDAELAYSVHRVACAPTCRQLVTEVTRAGVVHRADGSSARVDSLALTRLATLADSLRLAELPPTLRLEGRLCRSVGSLRESLRVRFRVNGTLHQVMGLPWCTDATHPLDVFAAAVEAIGRP